MTATQSLYKISTDMYFNIENRRYTGSKAKLADWIMTHIKNECNGKVFADIFAGTGVVSAVAIQYFDKIIINDLLYSNNIIYQAFFGEGQYNIDKLQKIVDQYNNIDITKLKHNYFSDNFGNKYFDINIAKLIGYIREDIEKRKKIITIKEYSMLLSSLIYSMDKIANTVGHYDAYIRKLPIVTKMNFRLIKPLSVHNVSIYRCDANNLVRNINADIVYIDPPYNSRQYNRFYHVLETLVKWDFPKLYGTALKPKPENSSEYCKVKAPIIFENLITDLNCKHIVVSYNNTYYSKSHSSRNKIALEQITHILKSKGKTKIDKMNYRFFNSGKTNFANHQEWLFITNVNEK